MTGRPLPRPSDLTRPFWDGTRRHQLWIQRCGECGHHIFYPRYICTACGSDELQWGQVSGLGTVFTYTVARRATHPGLAERVPYVIAVVQLDEGPKLTSNVVGIDTEKMFIGMRVRATYEDAGEVTLVYFEPAEDAS